MGTVYCGPFAAAIDEGTRYGHEGYAAQVLADGTESPHHVRDFREYRAGCDCGWRGTTVHPPTDAGEDAALDEWNDAHLMPLVRAEAARWVVPATALLDLIAELRRTSSGPTSTGPDGQLTARALGRFDVIEAVEARLEDIAVEKPAGRPSAGGGR